MGALAKSIVGGKNGRPGIEAPPGYVRPYPAWLRKAIAQAEVRRERGDANTAKRVGVCEAAGDSTRTHTSRANHAADHHPS